MEKVDIIIISIVSVVIAGLLSLSYYIQNKINYHSVKFSSK